MSKYIMLKYVALFGICYKVRVDWDPKNTLAWVG